MLFGANSLGQISEVNPAYLYRDTAGTTPVTAPGQSVGLWLDQSKGLVLGPELRTASATIVGSWTQISGVVTAAGSATTDNVSFTLSANTVAGRFYEVTIPNTMPGGSFYVDFGSGTGSQIGALGASTQRLILTCTAPGSVIRIGRWTGSPSGTIGPISVRELPGNHDTQATAGSRPIYGKHPANGYRNMLYGSDTLVTQSVTTLATQKTLSFTGTGTVTLTGTYIGALVGIGAGRTSLTFTPTAGTLTFTVTGSVTFAMLEDAAAFTTYQRTGASSGVAWPTPPSYDITEAGQPDLHYLHYNGVSSFMVSPTITPGIDKAQVFVGVRKLSDAALGMLMEFGPSVNATVGTWSHLLPDTTSAGSLGLDLRGNGTSGIQRISTGTAPATFVSAVAFDLSGTTYDTERPTKRINGATATVLSAAGSADTGGGNFTAQTLYTGRRGGTSLPFNGLVYSKIIRFGANLTSKTIEDIEKWVNGKTGAVFPSLAALDDVALLNPQTGQDLVFSASKWRNI